MFSVKVVHKVVPYPLPFSNYYNIMGTTASIIICIATLALYGSDMVVPYCI